MLIILSKTNNPYFNIAAEEYLLKNKEEDICFLYINSDSVISGKNQNTLAEINYSYVKKENIPVIRRLSGGGTVFHDNGNINFSFITNITGKNMIDFEKYTKPIIIFLKNKGITATLGKRNELIANNKKISGTASNIHRKRVIHHGTLLFNTNLNKLEKVLLNSRDNYKDKATKSVSSQVINISEIINNPISTDDFISELNKYLIDNLSAKQYELNKEEIKAINNLIDEKYSKDSWNYKNNPNYTFNRNYKSIAGFSFKIELNVKKGIINDATIISNAKEIWINKFIENALIGIMHSKEDVELALWDDSKYEEYISYPELIKVMF